MLHRGTSARAFWLTLASLCAVWFLGEPLASAIDRDPVPRTLSPVRVSVKTEPAFEMSGFFPNPDPQVQAVGNPQQSSDDPRTDDRARLMHATELPVDGIGYQVLAPGLQRNFGTYELVELIQQTSAAFGMTHPNTVVQVGDLSRRKGGTIRDRSGERVHSSHRNGLDVDINYLRRRCEDAVNLNDPSCRIGVRENLELMRLFVDGGPDPDATMVDTFYVSPNFIDRACRLVDDRPELAQRYREVLQRSEAMGGHQAHFHMRIQCPEASRSCPRPRLRRRDPCGRDRS